MKAEDGRAERLRAAWADAFVRRLLERLTIAVERIADALERERTRQ
jgi:hypothetical protein